VERPYVLDREDAIRFDQIITAILADDPGFATRCRALAKGGMIRVVDMPRSFCPRPSHAGSISSTAPGSA